MECNKKDERMTILNMIQEGKITVDEGTKLLAATHAHRMEDIKNDFTSSVNKFSLDVQAFAKEVANKSTAAFHDVSNKVTDGYKSVEPHLEKATKTVKDKSSELLGDASKTLEKASEILGNESKKID